jgi:hypothetical protein
MSHRPKAYRARRMTYDPSDSEDSHEPLSFLVTEEERAYCRQKLVGALDCVATSSRLAERDSREDIVILMLQEELTS